MIAREEPGRADEGPPARSGARVDARPRIALAAALTVLTFLLFPAAPAVNYPVYAVGAVAGDNVIAPFAFRVAKSADDLARQREALARTVRPVYVFVPSALDSAEREVAALGTALDSAFAAHARDTTAVQSAARARGVSLTGAEVLYLASAQRRTAVLSGVASAYRRWLSAGVAARGALDGVSGQLMLRRGGVEQAQASDSVHTYAEFAAQAEALRPEAGGGAGQAAYEAILSACFHPTIVADTAATEARRAQLRRSVSGSKFDIQAGQRLVGANEIVGTDQHDELVALHEAVARRQGAVPALRRAVGTLLFDALLIALLGLAVLIFRPRVYESLRSVVVITGVAALVVVGGALVSHAHPLHPELIPVGVAAVVISALFDRRIALIVAVLLAVLLGGQAAFRGTNALYLNIVGGAAAAYSVRAVRTRQQTYAWILAIAAGYAAAALAVGLTLDLPGTTILATSGYGVLNGVGSVLIALLVLPVAERYTGVETDLTLLEWSDLNRPLMRRLSLEAPGTFAHSMQIANLAEAGCRVVGANALLARVGAYYHDVGKLVKPQFFVENQPQGRNPHDTLTPLQSAQVIRNHVREGLQLAEAYGVPRAIRAFIAEHHGTMLITYFLDRARAGGGAPTAEDYRYPGPVPQSAETAILMLADGVEAAVRVLDDPTPGRVHEVVDHIVNQRLAQGQLRDAPLTLQQLELVKGEFARVLSGLHHTRIEYPAAIGGVSARFGAT